MQLEKTIIYYDLEILLYEMIIYLFYYNYLCFRIEVLLKVKP